MIPAQRGESGRGPVLGRLLRLQEDGRILHLRADIHADQPDRTGDKEGDAPPPFVHRRIAKVQRIAKHQRGAEGKARERSEFEEAAIEAGAQDFEPGEEEGSTLFITAAADLDLVSRALPAHGFTVLSAKLGYKAKNPVDPATLSAEQLEEVEAFLAAIDANDDVQNMFVALAG